jgi:CHAD domain-containing protein
MGPAGGRVRPPKGSAPSHAQELELKYAIADIDRVRALVGGGSLAGLTIGPWRQLRVVDRYVDTASRLLERAGYGARLRRVDGRTVLTVKGLADRTNGRHSRHSALARRLELEAPANQRLQPTGWPASPARALLETAVGAESLRTLFTINQQREEADLLRGDGSKAATLSLDAAEVVRFGRRLGSFSTLEVEAVTANKAGQRTLGAIAAELEASDLLVAEPRSKEAIGQLLVDSDRTRRQPSRPPRAPGVLASDTLAEAGRKVLRMHLLRMLSSEDGVRAGDGTEPVHKMRVATRRMRAAWRVFAGAYRRSWQARYVGELRLVAQALGAVRDLDVQLERLAGYRQQLASEQAAAAIEPLAADYAARRQLARRQLLDLLASPAYDRFVVDYSEFVETVGAGARPGAELVRDSAGGRCWRAFERVRAHELLLPWADVAALHSLRIDSKRLRYTLEFFAEILPPAAQQPIALMTALQDHLGLLNDAQLAADSTRRWLMADGARQPTGVREAAGAYLAACEADVARLRRTFRPLWRRAVSIRSRRRLALALAAI